MLLKEALFLLVKENFFSFLIVLDLIKLLNKSNKKVDVHRAGTSEKDGFTIYELTNDNNKVSLKLSFCSFDIFSRGERIMKNI